MNKTVVIRRVVVIGALIVILSAVALLAYNYFPEYASRRTQDKVRSLYYGSNAVPFLFGVAYAEEAEMKSVTTPAPSTDSTPDIIPAIQEDFLALYDVNTDIVGWLNCGDSIDYPVVQRDNSFYLSHDFYGKHDINGTLFVNECNTFFPRDDVILIHGHNMNSGAMFGKLQRYMDYDYLCRHPIVTFRTVWDAMDVYYTPVAVFNASMIPTASGYFDITRIIFADDDEKALNEKEEITMVFSSEIEVPSELPTPNPTSVPTEIPALSPPAMKITPEPTARKSTEFQGFLDELDDWTLWKPAVDVRVDDDLLMLVTCSYYHDDGRLMVVCRALREDETRESIENIYASKQKR